MAQKSFLPWVGEHYRCDETKLLLLGESAYSWGKRKDQRPTLNLPTILVKEVLGDFARASDFMKKLSRGLAGEKEPTKERLHHVWHRVAFTNYVGGTVGEGPRIPPTHDMWKAAKGRLSP